MEKKKNVENKDPLILLEQLMVDFSIPDWLRKKTVKILETKRETMTDEVFYRYLNQLGSSETNTLPDEVMNEEWLQSVYASHSDWVEKEINFLEETTYESFNKHLERTSQQTMGIAQNAQRSYIAISSSLLNVFAQIDDVFYQKKTIKSRKNEESSSNLKSIFRTLKATIGYLFIILGYMSAFAGFILSKEDGFGAYISFYLFFGIFPFLVGLFLAKDVKLKNFYRNTTFRIYIYFSLVVPCAFTIFSNFNEWKQIPFKDPDFILFHLVSLEWVDMSELIIFIMIILLLGPITIWRENRKKLLISFSIFFIVLAILEYVTINDYRAIGADNVVQSTFGSKHTYEWEEVEGVHLYGDTNSISKTRRDFEWSFIFYMENGDTVSFGPFGYKEGSLEDTLKIKNKIEMESIPMEIDELTEEDHNFVEVDMDFDEPELKDDFFKLFEIDSF